ncbi:hypothetical protein T492DRAFT_962603 [Pavlovales sp. CCMP2436]|nr:hypothetical protein T492DRAFT_962603 [Pavlovales sp. CCMP2436]
MGCASSAHYAGVAPREAKAQACDAEQPAAFVVRMTATTDASPPLSMSTLDDAVDPADEEMAVVGLTKAEDAASRQHSAPPHELSAEARARAREAEGFGVHHQAFTNDPLGIRLGITDDEPAFTGLTQAADFSWGLTERGALTDALAMPIVLVQPANEGLEASAPSSVAQDDDSFVLLEQLAVLDLSMLRGSKRSKRRSISDTDVPISLVPASSGLMLPPAFKPRRWTSEGAVDTLFPSLASAESSWAHGGSGLIPKMSGAYFMPSLGLVERYSNSSNYAELQWGPAARGMTEPIPRRSLVVVTESELRPVSGMGKFSSPSVPSLRIPALYDGSLLRAAAADLAEEPGRTTRYRQL